MSRRLQWILLAVMAVLCTYGFVRGRLWEQNMWSETGASRFLWFTAVYWAAAAALLAIARHWIFCAALGIAFLYSAWWAGLAAPIAVVYFLGSCWCWGRLARVEGVAAILTGAALWMAALWVALHFPINFAWSYGAAFAVPYLALAILRLSQHPRQDLLPNPGQWRASLSSASTTGIREALAAALLSYLLFAHLLAALKPDTSADGLSMHLALPMSVQQSGEWGFDFLHATWALMPVGGDALYTAVYLLGGESAAQMLNAAFLAISCVLIAQVSRRWVSPATSWLAAALFASTPLVQLVTASLFIENIWAAFLLGAAAALQREDTRTGSLLTGAAMAVKLIAAAFAIPLLLWTALIAWKHRSLRMGLSAAACFVALAAPVYAYAWTKSGNPVYPFANATFRSPYFDSERSFSDARYEHLRPEPRTPYDLTFHSSRYIEGQEGSLGFQYLLLLPAALLLAVRRDRAGIAAVMLAGGVIVLIGAPNLRYLYPALPLASIAIAWISPRTLAIAAAALIPLNLWFLPASGWYNTDFALFRHSEIAPYVERMAPARVLIAQLNRDAPGQPVALFSTDTTAGLQGPAYTDTWHSERHWKEVRNAPSHTAIATHLRDLGISRVIAPANREAPFEVVQQFFEKWLDPLGPPVGRLALYRLRTEAVAPPRDTRPLAPGQHDDLEPRIEFSGSWLHDPQWAEAFHHSLTYSDQRGDTLRLTFSGTAITYLHTKAANRGVAEVWIDGRLRRRLNLHASETQWQQGERFANLNPGDHTLEIRVGAGGFVDLDGITVE